MPFDTTNETVEEKTPEEATRWRQQHQQRGCPDAERERRKQAAEQQPQM